MEKLPERCPECNHAFSTLVRPKSRMQKKAIMLFLVGIGFTFPWAAAVIAVLSLSPVIVIPRSVGAVALMVTVGVLVVFGPGLAIGQWAMRIPRVTTLKCRQCGWSDVFVRRRN